jgi:hypothetical protein
MPPRERGEPKMRQLWRHPDTTTLIASSSGAKNSQFSALFEVPLRDSPRAARRCAEPVAPSEVGLMADVAVMLLDERRAALDT